METYTKQALDELKKWQKKMTKKPSFMSRLSKKAQRKMNSWIPEKIHRALTTAIKQMTRTVLFGINLTTKKSHPFVSLQEAEEKIQEKIQKYKKTAAIEGGVTGAGGILLGLADFPLLLTLKIKMLFDIASIYGFNISDYRERLYILYIFQLAFSSPEYRHKTYIIIKDWEEEAAVLPKNIHEFDWRNFQQEYRDYIDLAKMAQLLPVIGAPVGVIVNYRLIEKLGKTAMNAYRMRLHSEGDKQLILTGQR